jgi:hypothetical protein
MNMEETQNAYKMLALKLPGDDQLIISNYFMGYAGRLRGWGSSPGRVKNYYFFMSSRPTLGSTQPPIEWVPEALSRE